MTRKVGGGILANFDTVFSRFYDDVTGNLLSTVENNQSSLATRFISGDDLDQVFAQIRYSNGQLQTFNWWVTDLKSTPQQIMSEEATAPGMGSLLAQDYTAYGRPVDTNGAASAQPLPASYQAGYTARDYDEISGLQWNRARWYDPVLGQWLSDDPISFSAGDSNIRRYVGNSPTNATDPSGLAVLFGHEVLAPWDSRASWNPITTVKTWAGMGGVAISGVAGGAIPGAAGGAMTGGAVGGTVGLLGGPVGSGGGILAGAGAGGISGGISGGLNGLIKASRAETPGLTDAFRKGWDGSFTAGMVSGVVPGATAAAGPIKLAGGAMVPTAGGTLVVAPAVIVSTQTTVTAATAVSVPATVAMSGTPKENCETSPETPKGKLEQHTPIRSSWEVIQNSRKLRFRKTRTAAPENPCITT